MYVPFFPAIIQFFLRIPKCPDSYPRLGITALTTWCRMSSEDYCCWKVKQFLTQMQTWMIHYWIQKRIPLKCIISHLNPIHILTSSCSKILLMTPPWSTALEVLLGRKWNFHYIKIHVLIEVTNTYNFMCHYLTHNHNFYASCCLHEIYIFLLKPNSCANLQVFFQNLHFSDDLFVILCSDFQLMLQDVLVCLLILTLRTLLVWRQLYFTL